MGSAPQRFHFRLYDNKTFVFNYMIIVDIFFLESKPIFYIVDEATQYQSVRFLRNQSTEVIWDTL